MVVGDILVKVGRTMARWTAICSTARTRDARLIAGPEAPLENVPQRSNVGRSSVFEVARVRTVGDCIGQSDAGPTPSPRST